MFVSVLKSLLTAAWIVPAAALLVIELLAVSHWEPSSNAPYRLLMDLSPSWLAILAASALVLRVMVREVPRSIWWKPRRVLRDLMRRAFPSPASTARTQAPEPAGVAEEIEFRPGDNAHLGPSGNEIAESIETLQSSFDEDSYIDLFRRVAYPYERQVRVAEKFSIEDGIYRHRVSRTVDLTPYHAPGRNWGIGRSHAGSQSREATTIVPILWVRKGELIDNLSCTASSGTLSTLSYAESQGATAQMLLGYFTGITDRRLRGRVPLSLRRAFRACLREALGPPAQEDAMRANSAWLAHEFRAASLHSGTGQNSDEIGNLLELHGRLSRYYLVFAAVTTLASRVKIVVERDLPETRAQRADGRSTGSLLSALGKPTTFHRFQLGHLAEAPSYHVYVRLPEETYLYRRDLGAEQATRVGGPQRKWFLDLDGWEPAAGSGQETATTRLATSPTVAYLHMYARNASEVLDLNERERPVGADPDTRGSSDQDTPVRASVLATKLFIELRERPPGFAAALLAVVAYLAGIAAILTRFNDYVFTADTPGGTWGALAVAAPSLATAWLGSRLGNQRKSRTSVLLIWSAVGLMAGAVALSLTGSGLLLANGEPQTTGRAFDLDWATAWVTSVLAIMIIGLFVVQRFVADVWRYHLRRRASQYDGAPNPTEKR